MANCIRITNKWGHWFYVMPEFIEIVPNYKKISHMSLIIDYGITTYLHNPDGPAMEDRMFGFDIPKYYINGQPMSKAQHYTVQFHNKLEDLLDE